MSKQSKFTFIAIVLFSSVLYIKYHSNEMVFLAVFLNKDIRRKKMQKYDIKELGPAPIIKELCDQLGIRNTVNRLVRWDAKQWLVDPGTLVIALIIVILSGRKPLYRIHEFFHEQDVELLFGEGIESTDFNDDNIGRTLDRISEAGANRVYSSAAFNALHHEDIEHETLHGDTTSMLVYGEYEEEGNIDIVKGYNQLNIKDRKQFKIGLAVTKDGFPLLGEVLSGNLDDKTWNKEFLDKIPKHFTLEQMKDMVYIADAAFTTEGSLEKIANNEMKFISRLPASYNLTSELVHASFDKNEWEEIGKIKPGKKKAEYKLQEFTNTLYDKDYRFIVVHSSQKDKRKLKGLKTRINKGKKALEKAITKEMKLIFACEEDAKDALNRFKKEKESIFYPLTGTVESKIEKVKRNKMGRPTQGEIREKQVFCLNIELGAQDEDAVVQEKERLSCFVLITNIPNETYSPKRILTEYKEQNVVENRFTFIKSPYYVGPMYLHNKNRLEALSYVVLMALMVYIVLQRRVRMAMETETKPLEITGNKKTFEPTGNKILELLNPIKIIYMKEDGIIKRVLPERYNYLRRVIKLIGFDMNIYTTPKIYTYMPLIL